MRAQSESLCQPPSHCTSQFKFVLLAVTQAGTFPAAAITVIGAANAESRDCHAGTGPGPGPPAGIHGPG